MRRCKCLIDIIKKMDKTKQRYRILQTDFDSEPKTITIQIEVDGKKQIVNIDKVGELFNV